MTLQVFCPKLKCGGSKEVTCCLYLCERATVLKCPEYAKVYPQLLNFEVEQKYLDRYGAVTIPVPPKFLRRRPRGTPKPLARPG